MSAPTHQPFIASNSSDVPSEPPETLYEASTKEPGKRSQTQLTVEQYVSKRGAKCPVCRSPELDGGSVEIDAGTAWQKVGCNSCNAEWTDQYQLTGYTDLQK